MVRVPTVWWGYSKIGYYLLTLGYCLFGGVTPCLVGELSVWWWYPPFCWDNHKFCGAIQSFVGVP